MRLSDIGAAGQQVDVLNGGDVDPTGRLLSVAEIQQAFRELRRRRDQHSTDTGLTTTPQNRAARGSGSPHTVVHAPVSAPHTQTDPTGTGPHSAQASAIANSEGGRLDPSWTVVIAAHSGAGASTVALAIADAFAGEQRACRLIEAAHPARSGLVAVATAELGTDPSGAWRRGSRHVTTVYRRTTDIAPIDWPDSADADATATIVDLGLPARANLARLAADQPRLVVVCKVTVPGVRLAEQLLAELEADEVVLAAVGPSRWSGAVSASRGPRLRGLREAGRVVSVPEDRRLQMTGPSTSVLPKPVAAAGRALLRLIEADHRAGGTIPARPASRKREAS